MLNKDLLRKNVKIGIVTAAGYTTADKYYARLHGLLDALAVNTELTEAQKSSVIIMGGEANYLFEYSASSEHLLAAVPRERWLTPEMRTWDEGDMYVLHRPSPTYLILIRHLAWRTWARRERRHRTTPN